MLALAGCGGDKNPSQSTEDNNSTPDVSTPSVSTPVEDNSTSTSTPSVDTPEKKTIAEVVSEGLKLTAGSGQNAAETAKAYEFEGTVIGIYGNSYMLQEADAGLMVYNKKTDGVAIGKKVNVVSTVMNYYGLVETKTVTSATVVGEGDTITPATITSVADIKTGVLVNIDGLKYTGTKGSNFYEVSLDDEKSSIYVDNYLDDDLKSSVAALFDDLKANDTLSVKGGAGYSPAAGTTNNRITICSIDQLEIVHGDPVEVESVTAVSSVEVAVGKTASLEAKVLPENADDQELIFVVEDPSVAEVISGKVKGLAEGSTTITVKAHADETKTATVSVTVIPADESAENSSYDFSGVSTTANTTLNTNELKELFATNVTGTDIVSEVTSINWVYKAKTTEGPNVAGIKFGKSGEDASFTITTSETIKTVKVTLHSWRDDTASSLDINGISKSSTAKTRCRFSTTS